MIQMELQPSRDNWPVTSKPRVRKPISRASLTGLALISALTLWMSAWLAYRFLLKPDWIAGLPALGREIMFLMEIASVATLVLVWSGLLWRRRRRQTRASRPVSVESLYALSPAAFERYVAGLFRQRGYQVRVRGGSGDHGVDLELLGGQGKRAIVQCKRYRSVVGEELVRELYGTLIHEKAAHAFLVTTAAFSASARRWASGKPITLIDGETLVEIAVAQRERLH